MLFLKSAQGVVTVFSFEFPFLFDWSSFYHCLVGKCNNKLVGNGPQKRGGVRDMCVSLSFQLVVRGQTQGLLLHLLADAGVISVIEMVNVYSLKNRYIRTPATSSSTY